MKLIHTENKLNKLIAKGAVLLDFSATWCGPCKALGKQLKKIEEKYPHVTFVKIDVDGDEDDLADEYGVTGIPHVVLFKDGKKFKTIVGNHINKIITGLNTILNDDMGAVENSD